MKNGGKSVVQWRASVRDYAVPKIGTKREDRISTANVMEVLLPIWSTKRETARRVSQRVDVVMCQTKYFLYTSATEFLYSF